jgi:hypothetical protein
MVFSMGLGMVNGLSMTWIRLGMIQFEINYIGCLTLFLFSGLRLKVYRILSLGYYGFWLTHP